MQRPRHKEQRLFVRLTRKLANVIDGVNLTDAQVGDRLDLSRRDAEVLIAEGWAERSPRTHHTIKHTHAQAADKPRRKKRAK